MKICKVEGCNGKHKAKGYCNKHYKQLLRHGKILERSHKDLNEIIEYESIAEASRKTGISETQIRRLIDKECVNKTYEFEYIN